MNRRAFLGWVLSSVPMIQATRGALLESLADEKAEKATYEETGLVSWMARVKEPVTLARLPGGTRLFDLASHCDWDGDLAASPIFLELRREKPESVIAHWTLHPRACFRWWAPFQGEIITKHGQETILRAYSAEEVWCGGRMLYYPLD